MFRPSVPVQVMTSTGFSRNSSLMSVPLKWVREVSSSCEVQDLVDHPESIKEMKFKQVLVHFVCIRAIIAVGTFQRFGLVRLVLVFLCQAQPKLNQVYDVILMV